MPVTADLATHVSPFWSADWRYLFYLSDRAGTYNIWRVPIDETTGRLAGEPEPMTLPARMVGERFWIATDGRHLAYSSLEYEFAIERVGFDATAARVSGDPVTVLRSAQELWGMGVARDGSWIGATTLPPEDIAVVSNDGGTFRRLTDDAWKDRYPSFSPDGRRLAFQSDRSGRWEIWTIDIDGRGLRQLTKTTRGNALTIPIWSPGESTIAVSVNGEAPRLLRVAGSEVRSESLPEPPVSLIARSWAPDGARLAFQTDSHEGIWTYTLGAPGYERLTEKGWMPTFLPDGHRLLYLDHGLLRLLDMATKRSTTVLSSDEAGQLEGYTLTADGRSLFLLRSTGESGIWMATLP